KSWLRARSRCREGRSAVDSTGPLPVIHNGLRGRMRNSTMRTRWLSVVIVATFFGRLASAGDLAPVAVEGQPLAANVKRLLHALDYLGAPLPADTQKALKAACDDRDGEKIQRFLDPHVLLAVHLNPEVRVKVARGPARATLQQAGYTPVLVKVTNDST